LGKEVDMLSIMIDGMVDISGADGGEARLI